MPSTTDPFHAGLELSSSGWQVSLRELSVFTFTLLGLFNHTWLFTQVLRIKLVASCLQGNVFMTEPFPQSLDIVLNAFPVEPKPASILNADETESSHYFRCFYFVSHKGCSDLPYSSQLGFSSSF